MRKLILAAAVIATAAMCLAGQTATFLKNRVGKTADVTMGKWNWQFKKAKAYAIEKGIPLIAVWSNGDSCSHCTKFESALDSSAFKEWMKKSGCVFYFTYPGDGGEGKKESSTFHWIRGNNTSYPFVRVYWKSGGKVKVDITTVGDVVDGNERDSAGGKNAVNYFKNKLKAYKPKLAPADLPYQIAFDPNYPTASDVVTKDAEMETMDCLYGFKTNLPVCAFACSNVILGTQYAYAFSGWAKSATGSVAYKDGVAVEGLTDVSNKVITLYARWTKMTYGPYYTGVSKTVRPVDYLNKVFTGYKPASTPAGLKWSTSKYYWTGKPTKAGTYTITFKKSSSSIKRTFIIVKDEVRLDGLEIDSDNTAWTDTSAAFDQPIAAVSGDLTSITVSGLPEGLSYRDGKIVGRAKTPGLYTVTVSGKTKNSQTVKKTFSLMVEEGDALLLNGMAHADEMWAFVDEPLSYSVSAKLKKEDEDGFEVYELRKISDATVTVTGEDGQMTVDGFEVAGGKFTGTMTMSGVYSVTIDATVDEEPLSLTFDLNVLEGDPEPEEEEPEPEEEQPEPEEVMPE